LADTIRRLVKEYPGATVSFEYNGYNLGSIVMQSLFYGREVIMTMTTMPQAVTPVFCGAVANHDISAIALSYDSEKVSNVNEWVEKAKMIKGAGMKVSCNFLLESTTNIPEVPREILETADQLNLLALKPTGKIKNIEGVNLLIEYCKGLLPVAVDNCLGYQLGYIDYCGAGEDFCHVRPDGSVVDCCFQRDCFLWLKRNSESIIDKALKDGYPQGFEVSEYIQSRKRG